jgi:hypothetical protein
MNSTASNVMRAIMLTAALVIYVACGAKAPDIPTEWKTDCVGRSQISLPPDIEVAVTSRARMDAEMDITHYRNERTYSFPDGTAAGYTSLFYTGGDTLISETSEKSQLEQWINAQQTRVLPSVRQSYKGKISPDGKRYAAKALKLKSPLSSAYRFFGSQHYLITVVGERAVKTAITTDSDDETRSITYIDSFIQSMSPRQLFEVPSTPGVCMPYLFIKDSGEHPRGVAVTYRLKSHPDITIMLEDQNGGPIPADVDPDKVTAEYDNDFFWRLDYQSPKRAKALWLFLHEIKLAGNDGYASFMELTRKDDTTDYGFFAAARDYRDSPEATNLRMFVIRDAKNARAKGIEPMGEDEFIELAQTIAASIKRRPVTN